MVRRSGFGGASVYFDREGELTKAGYLRICGVDEAGRGPLAGPVVAAAVVLDVRRCPVGLDDSKRLSVRERERLYDELMATADVGVGIADVEVIDRDNILVATMAAMSMAVVRLRQPPDYALVDGPKAPKLDIKTEAVVGGDRKVRSIMAASIVAKVTRDRLMMSLDAIYPGYGFARHKGYCTPAHIAAINRLGRCPAHRASFRVPGFDERTGDNTR